MKKILKKSIFLLLLFIGCIGYSQTTHPEPVTLKIGSKAPNFSLPGVDGKTYTLKSLRKRLYWLLFLVVIIVLPPRLMKTG